jgi:hypothetical protein
VINLSALQPYVVVADGVVGVYRTALAVKHVAPTFATWIAYDVRGRRVQPTGGRVWHPLGIEIGVLPRLLPVGETAVPEFFKGLLVPSLDLHSAVDSGASLRATIERFAAQIGWRDDDPANCVPAPRTVEHSGGT